MKSESSKAGFDRKRAVRSLVTGTIIGTAVSFLVILLAVFFIIKSQAVPYQAIAPISIAAASVGSFCGGYISARLNKSLGMAAGTVCGGIMFVLLAGLGLITGGTAGLVTLLRLALMLLFGAAGGVLGVNKRRKRK